MPATASATLKALKVSTTSFLVAITPVVGHSSDSSRLTRLFKKISLFNFCPVGSVACSWDALRAL